MDPPAIIPLRTRLWTIVKSLATLFLLWSTAAPLITVTVVTYLLGKFWWVNQKKGKGGLPHWNGETAIVTGGKMTKSLHTCRHLKRQGFRVILLETHKYWMVASRFSNSVDKFVTVSAPEQDRHKYRNTISAIVAQEDVTLFVPTSSPAASIFDASLKRFLPSRCRVISPEEDEVKLLDDKTRFGKLATTLGLPVPATTIIRSKSDLMKINHNLVTQNPSVNCSFILKSLVYDPIHRLDLFQLPAEERDLKEYLKTVRITAEHPWCIQEYLRGKEYSAWVVCDQGMVLCFSVSPASSSCYNWTAVEYPEIEKWVRQFVSVNKLSGSMCFDFLTNGRPGDRTPYAIECNPRTSSIIVLFHNHPELGRVWLRSNSPRSLTSKQIPLRPLAASSAKSVHWLYHELYQILFTWSLAGKLRALSNIWNGQDAYWSLEDPFPFAVLYLVHIPILLIDNVFIGGGNPWSKIDFCIGKLTELNGD